MMTPDESGEAVAESSRFSPQFCYFRRAPAALFEQHSRESELGIGRQACRFFGYSGLTGGESQKCLSMSLARLD